MFFYLKDDFESVQAMFQSNSSLRLELLQRGKNVMARSSTAAKMAGQGASGPEILKYNHKIIKIYLDLTISRKKFRQLKFGAG